MSVPEAAMHEYNSPVTGKDQIGASRKVISIETETKAQPVCDPTYGNLGSCVAALDVGHHLASPLAIHDVSHSSKPKDRRASSGLHGAAKAGVEHGDDSRDRYSGRQTFSPQLSRLTRCNPDRNERGSNVVLTRHRE